MAEPLKNFFNSNTVAQIGAMIAHAYPPFELAQFTRAAGRGLEELELLPRGWHIAHALKRFLPADFESAAGILKASLGERLPATENNGMMPFLYLPHVFYVAEYGRDHLEAALDLQYELTKRFSAEYSMRVFIERYPAQTLARLRLWARDPDVHVRRLVSEGTRPRLPWAPRLRQLQRDPTPVLELLELLKDDPELYVRRSVANNLNDIGKDHPDILFETCRRWSQDATPERAWLIKHALRSAIKRAETGALEVLGFHHAPAVTISNVKFSPRDPVIGESLRLSFEVASEGRRQQSLLVDVRVHFVKADGGTRPKVFKLKTVALATRASATFNTTIGLRQLTTRKHYPGKHHVEVMINGVAFPIGSFSLKARAQVKS
ncbi:MAG TPA: hypothetical protein VFO52_03435 [Longimicrobiales bacterium]|nr:hypothetical protein [Longimicrobiales bacterium]